MTMAGPGEMWHRENTQADIFHGGPKAHRADGGCTVILYFCSSEEQMLQLLWGS